MRVLADIVKRAMAKKKKRAASEAEGARRTHPRSQSPNPPLGEPQPSQGAAPPIDLTAETPPEESRAEAVLPSAEPVPDEGSSGGDPSEGEVGEEHPPAVGPSVEEMSAASGTMPAASASIGPAEGSGLRAVPSRPSLMNHGRVAEQLLASTCLPEFQEELRCQGCSAFFRDASAAMLWLVNSLTVAREVTLRADRALRRAERETAAAQARVKRAEGALEAARVEREELEEARHRAAAELECARVAEERVDAAWATIEACDMRIHTLYLEVKDAEQLARDAVADKREALQRASKMEAAVRAAKERAAAAEKAAAEAVERY